LIDVLFRVDGDGQYCLAAPDSGIELRADHLRRDHRSGELTGELTVSCGAIGKRVVDGILSIGNFNFSSVPARSQRAKLLRERARSNVKVDFLELLESFCQHIAHHERQGDPAVILRDVPRPTSRDTFIEVLGMRYPSEHLSIGFGAGGTMKSLLALVTASHVAKQGGRVLYADWELDQSVHRERLEQINGSEMPDAILYCRCDRPLVHEIDRLRRIVRAEQVTYVILDSVAYGTAGDPAEAGAAMDYCRATRQLGVGANAIAHITKNGENNDRMPYGSVFWHNSARATWNIKLSSAPDPQTLNLAAFNRKYNLGAERPPVGVQVQFDGDRVYFQRIDVAAIEDVAKSLPLHSRMKALLKSGPQTLAAIASELDHDNVESIDRIVRHHKTIFVKVTGRDGIVRVALGPVEA
jgi:hypothetical protein